MVSRAQYRLHAPDTALDRHPVLSGIEAEVLANIKARSYAGHAPAGAALVSEDALANRVLFLHSGSIRQVSSTAGAEELTTMILRAPAMVGAAECVLDRPPTSWFETLERVTFTGVPRAVLRSALKDSPLLVSRVLKDTAALLCAATRRQNGLTFAPAHVRVGQALWSLVQAYGVPVEGGFSIRLPFSRDLLASLIGINRRSVARGLRCWFERGALVRSGRHLVVRDIAPLRHTGGVPLVYTSGSPHNPWLGSLADLDPHRLYA